MRYGPTETCTLPNILLLTSDSSRQEVFDQDLGRKHLRLRRHLLLSYTPSASLTHLYGQESITSSEWYNNLSVYVAKYADATAVARPRALLVANTSNAWLRDAYSPAFWSTLASSRLFHAGDWKCPWANRLLDAAVVAEEVTTLLYTFSMLLPEAVQGMFAYKVGPLHQFISSLSSSTQSQSCRTPTT